MDLTTLSNFKDLGIAGICVVVLGYITIVVIKQLGESRRDYKSYVEDNNHTTTDLVIKATETMVQVKNSIESQNEIMKNHNETLRLLIDRLNK